MSFLRIKYFFNYKIKSSKGNLFDQRLTFLFTYLLVVLGHLCFNEFYKTTNHTILSTLLSYKPLKSILYVNHYYII